MSFFKKPLALLTRLRQDRKGVVAIIFGLSLLPAVFATGMAMDYGMAMRAKTSLQAATDAAALAGATLLGASTDARTTLATNVFNSNLPSFMNGKATATVQSTLDNVAVAGHFTLDTSFMRLAGVNNFDLAANANVLIDTAVTDGSICLLALDSSPYVSGIALGGNSTIADKNCWAWSNSTSNQSLNAWGSSDATAAGFCTAGGVYGSSRFTPAPLTSCAQRPDPFVTLAMPAIGGCEYNSKQYNNGTWTVSPNASGVTVFCNGLDLKPQADVTFPAGIYVIKNGKFSIQAQSTARGTGVMFVFSGVEAYLEVKGGGNADLKAPVTGTYAGFLMIDNRNDTPEIATNVTGGGSITLEGIVYQPSRALTIGGNGQINQNSKYFAMVAKNYSLGGTGDLYMKTDYAAAGFPDLLPKVTRLTRMTQ